MPNANFLLYYILPRLVCRDNIEVVFIIIAFLASGSPAVLILRSAVIQLQTTKYHITSKTLNIKRYKTNFHS